MNIANTPWRYPHSLERREGIDQPVRRGCNAEIRAGLRALLGVTAGAAGTVTRRQTTPVVAQGRRAEGLHPHRACNSPLLPSEIGHAAEGAGAGSPGKVSRPSHTEVAS